MNKMASRRVSRIDKLIFFNYRRACVTGAGDGKAEAHISQ